MTTISSDVKRYIVPENRMWDESSWKLPVLKNEQIMVLASDYDTLAAHVERIRDAGAELVDLMDGVREGDYKPDSFTNQPMVRALTETPATSLARLKAQWQAEVLDSLESRIKPLRQTDNGAQGKGYNLALEDCLAAIDMVRRQAEGGDDVEVPAELVESQP